MTVLEALKAIENRAALRLFINNDQAKDVLVAWTLYKPECTDRPLKKGETLDAAYEDLWEHVDFEKLSDSSGVPWRTCAELFGRMRNAKLVFPDGTIMKAAYDLIVTEVASVIEERTPASWKKARDKARAAAEPKK